MIYHSLYTKPLLEKMHEEEIRNYMFMHALSLTYAIQNHYNILLYTDKYGIKLTNDFPYLDRVLLEIPDDNPCECLKAQCKFYALQKAELGWVHIDTDVYLKAQGILNFNTDLLVQNSEMYQFKEDKIRFEPIAKWLLDNGVKIDLTTFNGTYNCGCVGFNNQELKDKYLSTYFQALNVLKNKKYNYNFWLDLILEQQSLYELVNRDKYSVTKLFNNDYYTETLTQEQDRSEYKHLIGSQKYTNYWIDSNKRLLYKLNKDLYNIIINKDITSIIDEYKYEKNNKIPDK